MAEIGIIASVIGVAGAGFRLSLILNAVGVEMATADLEIQKIAKEISLFSLMLKQVGLTMEAAESVVSQSALDTAKEITSQSQTIFNEVKEMVEMSQKRDANGNLRSITIAQRVKWCFKKQRVQYLLGQLESLKLSLSIMLQILLLGKSITAARKEPSKPPLEEQAMLQERAEIQNMVVVRHWSLVDLRRLYQLAEDEATHPVESPPPSYQGIETAGGDPRLSIKASEHEENTSQALVKYHELPLSQLDASMNKAMYKPNRILHAPDDNVVDHLLDEWTRVREIEPRPRYKSHKYRARYESDDENDSHPEFERSDDVGGRYIEGPPNSAKSVKNVRFRARVESDSEDSEKARGPKKPPSRHILQSDEDSSTLSSSSSDSASLPDSRRNSASSATGRGSTAQDPSSSSRRYTPSTMQHGSPETHSGRPNIGGGPPSPRQTRPIPIQSQTWQGQFTNNSLRPQHPLNIPPGPHRTQSGGSFGAPPPPAYGSPNPQSRPFYPPPSPGPSAQYYQPKSSHRSRHRPSREKRQESRDHSFQQNTKKNVKRGLIGAGAVAGLMDILEGLGAI